MQNPVLEKLLFHIQKGRALEAITTERPCRPQAVIFHFHDLPSDRLSITCDRATFMKWWRRTGIEWWRYWRTR